MLADTRLTREFHILLQSHGCSSVISVPTRVTHGASTCLDLFITNVSTVITKAGVLSCSLSDHMPIFFCLKRHTKKKTQRLSPSQLITPNRLESFRTRVQLLNWSDAYVTRCAESAYEEFLRIFSTCYQEIFPLRTKLKRSSHIRKRWITDDLFRKIKFKNMLFNKFVKSRNVTDLHIFKRYRNKLTNELRKAKTSYEYEYFVSCQNDSRKTWKKINSMLNRASS